MACVRMYVHIIYFCTVGPCARDLAIHVHALELSARQSNVKIGGKQISMHGNDGPRPVDYYNVDQSVIHQCTHAIQATTIYVI